MAQSSPAPEPHRGRVLIPLDDEAALRALMRFRHSQQPAEPPAAREHDPRG
jgi:hypothetical protein